MQRPEPEPQSFDRVLSSMCTEPHSDARAAAERFLAANPGDPATYETVAALEERAVERLATLAEHPIPSDAAGYVTSGGTEANVQAVRSARNRHDGGRDDRGVNVVAPESAHFSFTKAAELLDVELRTVPVDDDYRADTDAVAAAVDDATALVVGVAGTTEYGRVDPIPELAAIAAEAGARFHVDAAWGGFVLPFTDHDWSFADAAVDTLTIDPHKFGQAPVPAGGLLAREDAALDALAVNTPYLESRSQATLTGTRSGAGVAGAVAAMDALWPDGYREAADRAADHADWLAAELADRGYDVVDPELPLVAAAVPESEFAALRDAGWKISRTGTGELRVVCMPHVTRSTLRAFLDDLDRIRG
ncbi:tyrosine decarboxylase MfnA [Halorubrum tebenquichense]|uniref:Probable L-aspartate decarboxylase n=1 Tax=Halorubrum tebenquichense DSM 14210 TaxID=1227485 RepID=M0DP61_9EURY|nr:tyrosine decarboxylase MfnA [Halorubrum tebenquichense]ELZ36472.1 L-tyrosine decarboxylase [Halorubrum tebenquichense DSM 14210]